MSAYCYKQIKKTSQTMNGNENLRVYRLGTVTSKPFASGGLN